MRSSCSTWAPTSSSATPMLSLAPAEFGEWEYVVMDPKGITLRGTPTVSQSAKLKVRVSEGELVKVVERRPAASATFLRLEKPAGWAVDCRDKRVRMKQVVVESGNWFYRVCTPNGIALRSGCCFSDGSKIGAGPREGALLVAEQRVQVDGTSFLKLQDSTGWVFDQKGSRRVLEGPLGLQDLNGRAATVTAPGGAFLLQQPTKKSWAQTRRLLLQDARVRVGLFGQLEGQTWAHVSQIKGMEGWLPFDAIALAEDLPVDEQPRSVQSSPRGLHGRQRPPRPASQAKAWTEEVDESTSASSRAS